MATIYVRQPGDFELFAYERNRRIGATVRGHVDPRSTGDLPVVLARMDRGMVAVSVTEADGTPVEPFALRFLRRDMLVRHVKSTELYQTRFVQGLPDLELEVQLDRSYSDGPVMYDVQGKAYQLVTPDPLGQTAVHFTVTRGARLAFDLSAPDASAHRYEVWRYRDEDRTDGRDGWHRLDVWQFRADSASCSIRITGQGRWFTSLLEPGEVRIQVRRMGQPDIVYDRWLSLAAGELKVQQLSD
ncbi:MAG TPA: hypothetical protein ENI87_03450 [bacterium]|nr:hypothetical protein [bacterium]